jgi:hypothetical protein
MMLSFLDFRKIPLAGLWAETHFGTYGDSLSHGGINMWINRHAERTTVTLSFPDNEVARESVHRYIATLSQMFGRAVNTPYQPDAIVNHDISDVLAAVAPNTDDDEAA